MSISTCIMIRIAQHDIQSHFDKHFFACLVLSPVLDNVMRICTVCDRIKVIIVVCHWLELKAFASWHVCEESVRPVLATVDVQ